MSVIGFDIGNESCVIATVKPGGVDVLLNDESQRETPAVVSFGQKQRFLGSAGAVFATTNPNSTVSQIKRLIGKLYKEAQEDLKLLPFTTSESPNGGILIELEYLKTKWIFTPMEILAMLFKHLKQITERNLETSVDECVIGIPSYFSDLQRRLYLDAAVVAGLKPLRLMHEGTAIALGYGMYKTDFSVSGRTNVMFVDIGHTDTQVTVAAFEQGKMKILSSTFDQNLGGRDFDEVLLNHFAAQFKEKYKIDVYSNVRACIRLRASCEKVKKVLSTNAEAPLSIDCLIGDTDVRAFITREEFENLSFKLLTRVIISCSMALKNSGLSIDEIHTIELVGCGSRVPAIARNLTLFFGKEPTTALNANEWVARGCAHRCAMLSPTPIVCDYEIVDSFSYSIVIPTQKREITPFPKGSPFPKHYIMNHLAKIPFYVQVAYKKEMDFPAGISHIIGNFGIGPREPSDAEEVKVEFRVKLNENGIVEIDSARILEDKCYSGTEMTGNSDMLNLPVIVKIDGSTTNDELLDAMEKEKTLTEHEMKVKETKDLRNSLESFVYDTRNKLSSTYWSHATDSEKEAVTNKLQETNDWLYEDSDDDTEQEFTGRLKDLKKLLEPIENRYNEEKAIAIAAKPLQTCIAKYMSHADSLPVEKKEKVKNICIEAEQWLISAVSQKHLSSKTMSGGINRTIKNVESDCETIIRSKPSFPRLKELMNSDQNAQTVEANQKRGQTADSENARTKEIIALQTCIAKYHMDAESLPADMKMKVNNVCTEAEKWLSSITQKDLPPKTLADKINHATDVVESKCNSIIRSRSSIPKHVESVHSDQRNQIIEPDQKDNPLGSNVTKAVNSLQICIEKYCSLAESLPADMKEKLKFECTQAEQWLRNIISEKHFSPDTITAYVNHAMNTFESNCETIIIHKGAQHVDKDQ